MIEHRRAWVGIAAGWACAVGGCSFGPGLSAGFDAPDPGARLHAIAGAGRGETGPHIPDLIDGLESDDPATRMLAIRSLEHLTGEDRGYAFDEDEASRAAAIQRWRAWLADQPPAGSGPVGPQQPIAHDR